MGLIVSESDYEPSEADTDSDAFVTLEERLGASDSVIPFIWNKPTSH